MTHYDTLGVSRMAPAAVIEAAWKALLKVHHPDKPGGSAAKAKSINDAHDVLSDPVKRRAYDAMLAANKPKRAKKPAVHPSNGYGQPVNGFTPVIPMDFPMAAEQMAMQIGTQILGQMFDGLPQPIQQIFKNAMKGQR